MSVPATIKYRGQLYKLAEHTRCEPGTHWHEERQACEKVKGTSKLGKAMAFAERASKTMSHLDAAREHVTAARHAHAAGYHELGQHHEQRAQEHRDQSAAAVARAREQAAASGRMP